MEFYNYKTTYELVKKECKKDREAFSETWHDFYNRIIDKFKNADLRTAEYSMRITAIDEFQWLKSGKPYYQIWPAVADEFLKTRLDIKCSFLKTPHKVFLIKLPILDNPLLSFKLEDGNIGYIKTINVVHKTGKERYRHLVDNKSKYADMLDFVKDDNEDIFIEWTLSYYLENQDKGLEEGTITRTIHLKDDSTIEEQLEKHICIKDEYLNSGNKIPASIIDATIRLLIAVHFLATGSHKVLEYDVLSKHLSAYRALEENNPKRKEYEHKAKIAGKYGWNIGYGRAERGLKLPAGVSYEEAVRNSGSRELLYQHTRGGHWHTVRVGQGKKDIKILWYEETLVRPDLPPAPLKI